MSHHDFQAPFVLPPGATEVVLLRHGSTVDVDPDKLFDAVDGHSDAPLSPRGHEQAEAVACRLATEEIDALFVTTLRRTAETAVPLTALTGLRPVVEPRLREVFMGEYELGRFRLAVAAGDPVVKRTFAEQRWEVIPGAERDADFAARVWAGINEVVRATGPGRAVAIVHGGVIAEVCRRLTDSRPFAFVTTENSSITRILRLADGTWRLRSFNDVAHLSLPAFAGAARADQ